MIYDEAMASAEAGIPVRRLLWNKGWQVRKEGGRLVYATSEVKAKSMGWTPTQLDRDARDWAYVDPQDKPAKGHQPMDFKAKRKVPAKKNATEK
jgi:hypothetical protein